MMKRPTEIFKFDTSGQNFYCLPEQVFCDNDFVFLFTIGGHLYENADEFQRLMNALKQVGEKQFYIYENIWATQTDRTNPFQATFDLENSDSDFQSIIKGFDDAFGLMPYHFYVYGEIQNWGIYLSEFPTINIVGCKPQLVDTFRNVYKIVDNGFAELNEFIKKEFSLMENEKLFFEFKSNYKIQ